MCVRVVVVVVIGMARAHTRKPLSCKSPYKYILYKKKQCLIALYAYAHDVIYHTGTYV